MTDKPSVEIQVAGFQVLIRKHTQDFDEKLTHPERLREILGKALDDLGLQEEIDYTLQVLRYYDR